MLHIATIIATNANAIAMHYNLQLVATANMPNIIDSKLHCTCLLHIMHHCIAIIDRMHLLFDSSANLGLLLLPAEDILTHFCYTFFSRVIIYQLIKLY